MYSISRDKLDSLYSAIAENYDLFMPIKAAGKTNYGFWSEGEEGDIDTLKTIRSGKDAFFPQVEQLYTVNREFIPADVAGGEEAEKAADKFLYGQGQEPLPKQEHLPKKKKSM